VITKAYAGVFELR